MAETMPEARPIGGSSWRPSVDVPLGVAAAALTVWWLVQRNAPPAAIVAIGASALAAPALVRIDSAERRLPNALTVPLAAIGLAAAVTQAVLGAWGGLVAGLGCTAFLLVLAIVGGMGMGDVKLGAGLALATGALGWALPITGLAASFVLGGLAGLAWLVAGRATLPFGPFLVAGHALAIALVA